MNLEECSNLPGWELVEKGICDLRDGRLTEHSWLVTCAVTRLRALGLEIPNAEAGSTEAELQLYRLLVSSEVSDPYYRYNSMLRRLVSFEQALEAVVWRERRAAASDRPELASVQSS
ncbi:MAG: hypothetical protein AUK47_03055 [Deltaproteobacteria bacterium CG2_30_63_29]|nr:MAG: hypothetical protein AUK47_03055 [Deltaproteobacteria bacterium CG2_30_63_29]